MDYNTPYMGGVFMCHKEKDGLQNRGDYILIDMELGSDEDVIIRMYRDEDEEDQDRD